MVPAVGPRDARLMLVGEAPGEDEVRAKEPFVGRSGQLLNSMLHDAGITRAECFITNVARFRPPNNEITEWIAKSQKAVSSAHIPLRNKFVLPPIVEGFEILQKEIELVRPNLIIAFGNVSMWALTGKWGIKSWRGSLLTPLHPISSSCCQKIMPAYHPAYILRDYEQRHITTHDLRKGKRESQTPTLSRPNYHFIIRPSFDAVLKFLTEIEDELSRGPRTISCDLETRAGHIACIGLALSERDAICIPFMCVESAGGYWLAAEEYEVVRRLKRVLSHPNARVIGQNFIYDSQYIYRHWGFVPNFVRDTMLQHHTCFAGSPKGLDYLSSLYCEYHEYWKDEGKEWNIKIPEEQYWAYNCKDAVITYEADQGIQKTVDSLGLAAPADFQQQMFWPVLQAMVRGVRVNLEGKRVLARELKESVAQRQQWVEKILGHTINLRSPSQLKVLFYEDFKQKEIYKRSTGAVTVDDEAIQKLGQREPLLRPLVQAVAEFRSLSTVLSNIGEARLGADNRLRCSYNIAGTETFRLASGEDAFGQGLNLQNITKGLTKGAMRGSYAVDFRIPNTRKIFIPDEGYTFFSGDLERADLQVVVWESGDDKLKAVCRASADVHTENARVLFGSLSPTSSQRELAKRWVHGTNYGGKPRTMAIACGITVHDAERYLSRWMGEHPGIGEWQRRTETQLRSKRFVENRFGYRRYYFDRPEGLLSEALAWIPQSTIGLYINKIWLEVYLSHPEIQVLLQVHDELAGQFPTDQAEHWKKILLDTAAGIVIPYEDPLVIPFKVKTGPSWGECE